MQRLLSLRQLKYICGAAVRSVATWCFQPLPLALSAVFTVDEFGLERADSGLTYVIVVCELHQPDCCFPRVLGFLLAALPLPCEPRSKTWIYLEILIL